MYSLRLDRTVTIFLGRPLVGMLNGHHGPRVPILMYHSVSEQSPDNRHPYYDTNTFPEIFSQHMKFLREHGFSSVDLATALSYIHDGKRSEKYVVITFDDGFRDFATTAFPILHENGFSATVYLVTGLAGKQKDGRDCLDWNEVRRLYSQGIEFGSHTVTHPELIRLRPAELDAEISHSKDVIEQELGARVQSFSYPYSFPEANREFGHLLRESLVKNGYDNGVSTIIGTAGKSADRYFLPRIPVNSGDDPAFFWAKLEGGYDWLYYFQYASKWAKEQLS